MPITISSRGIPKGWMCGMSWPRCFRLYIQMISREQPITGDRFFGPRRGL